MPEHESSTWSRNSPALARRIPYGCNIKKTRAKHASTVSDVFA